MQGNVKQFINFINSGGALVQAGYSNPLPVQIQDGTDAINGSVVTFDDTIFSGQGLRIVSFPALFDGTKWWQMRGDNTNGAYVNVKTSVLPTGAATATKQDDILTSLSNLLTELGQKTEPANSQTVVGTAADNAAASGNPVRVGGKYNSSNQTYGDGDIADLQMTIEGFARIVEQYVDRFVDNSRNKAVVEHRYSLTRVTADTQIKSTAGFVHTVTFAATGTVTAGVITVYDNTAESGTILFAGVIQVATAPVTITLDTPTVNGIYVGYDGTIANVQTSISWD